MISRVLVIVLALQIGAAAQQNDRRTWYQAYADAQRDIQQKNWNGAIANIEAASRLGAPKPGRNIFFYGDVYSDFNPDYYLGIAYLNLNRYDDADRAFERVKQTQLIAPRDKLYADFTSQAASAKAALEKQAVTQVADATPTVPPGIANPLPPPTTAVPDQPAPPSPVQQIPPPTVTPVPQIPDATGPGPSPGGGLPPTNAEGPRRGGPPNPNAPADQPPASKTAPQTPTAGSSLPVTTGQERSALVDFFSGQYEMAATKLSALTAGPNASLRAYFYLACSRAALALTGQVDATAAVAEARGQLALARDTGQFAADKALISPRIKQTLGMQP